MDESLIDDDNLSLDRKSRLPGEGFFYPDSLDENRADERAREALDGAEVVVITDSDADGLACIALIREAYGETVDPEPFERRLEAKLADDEDTEDLDTDDELFDGVVFDEEGEPVVDSPVALLPSGPRNLSDQLLRTARFLEPDTDVYICDICPDSLNEIDTNLGTITDRANEVHWFDHHQWPEETAEAIRNHGINLVVGESDEECSADVTLRSLDHDFSEKFRELAEVTRDHDLWIKEDERSGDLSDYSVWSSPAEYAAIIGTYGVDLPEVVREYIATRREEKEALIEKAVDRAETHEIGEWSVGVTYGRCSQNEVAETLRQQGNDAAVIVKPAGSASIRGSEGFQRAHQVARQVNGGGHPQAAGCKPGIYDDMLDYAHHWSSEGEAAKRVILAAFERVAERVEDEKDTETEENETDEDEAEATADD
jgi:oligoribonuclease NrnB/cAMP/cGMP phosphodiesterase (DHH superfamily)